MRITGTAKHSRRVAELAARTAAELGHRPTHVARLRMAGLVHDVGKAWIPARVLLKPGLLTPHEWMLIEAHPLTGAGLLSGHGLADIACWVLSHHERPDGRGYPRGLLAPAIPPEARILAVADAYDAMVSTRPNSLAIDRASALDELAAHEGTQFDPLVVAGFVAALARPVHRAA
jgi:putative nucleotidyltransferase with HDIG domain